MSGHDDEGVETAGDFSMVFVTALSGDGDRLDRELARIHWCPKPHIYFHDGQVLDLTSELTSVFASEHFIESELSVRILSSLESEWRSIEESLRRGWLDIFLGSFPKFVNEQARFCISCILGEQEVVPIAYAHLMRLNKTGDDAAPFVVHGMEHLVRRIAEVDGPLGQEISETASRLAKHYGRMH